MNRLTVLAVLAFAALGASAQTVVAPFTETFDAGALPAGWTLSAPLAGTDGTVTWAVDATPASVAGGPPTFGGSAGSLNFNDGVDYDEATTPGVDQIMSATSPPIDISGLGGTCILNFACNYDLATGNFFDRRQVQVFDSVGGGTLAFFDYPNPDFGFTGSTPPETDCAVEGTFHQHSHDLTAVTVGAGVTLIDIAYIFDAGESASGFPVISGGEGWFVDNVTVTCLDTIDPTIPVNVLPADGDCTQSPPGVLLDWSDSTDTTPCGPGTVANYVVQVDDDPAFASINFTATVTVSNATTGVLPPGLYNWRVRAVDSQGNSSTFSTVTTFVVEAAAAPLPPDTLFVNESSQGAQTGDGGFVDPLVDETPVFSAIYRDANTCNDAANGLRFQVSTDPSFVFVDFDSGIITLAPTLALNSRSPDQSISISLNRDTVYFWRIQFRDLNGALGAFSVSQSFRIGDDFDFGVRPGSSNHSRKCFVASAAYGSATPEVAGLMSFRSSVLESSAAGRAFTRSYAGSAPAGASVLSASPARRRGAALLLSPATLAASHPAPVGFLLLAAVMLLAWSARRRL